MTTILDEQTCENCANHPSCEVQNICSVYDPDVGASYWASKRQTLITSVIEAPTPCYVCCDGLCSKAYGVNRRPKEQSWDGYKFFADSEVMLAPIDPGTRIRSERKPPSIGPLYKHNKWCTHECERAVTWLEAETPPELPKCSERFQENRPFKPSVAVATELQVEVLDYAAIWYELPIERRILLFSRADEMLAEAASRTQDMVQFCKRLHRFGAADKEVQAHFDRVLLEVYTSISAETAIPVVAQSEEATYRVHFCPLIGDPESVEVRAVSIESALVNAIAKANAPDTHHDPENCTKIDATSIWREQETHWECYSRSDEGGWILQKLSYKLDQIALELSTPEMSDGIVIETIERLCSGITFCQHGDGEETQYSILGVDGLFKRPLEAFCNAFNCSSQQS